VDFRSGFGLGDTLRISTERRPIHLLFQSAAPCYLVPKVAKTPTSKTDDIGRAEAKRVRSSIRKAKKLVARTLKIAEETTKLAQRMACITLEHDATLLTRNAVDFAKVAVFDLKTG
jgi:hypothetical protein